MYSAVRCCRSGDCENRQNKGKWTNVEGVGMTLPVDESEIEE